MKILIASEFRCHIYKNEYYLSSKAYSIYKRYSDAFGKVILCSRFVTLDKLEKGLIKVDFIDDIVQINSLTKSLLNGYNKEIESKIKKCDLVIGRLPSVTAYKAADIALKNNILFLAELMCDGWDPYWNHGLTGKLIAPYMHLKMRKVTSKADYAVYVTKEYLQNRYPCKNESINASNVLIKSINKDVLQKRIERIKKMPSNILELDVMTTASIDLLSKGQRFVVRAMGELKKEGIRINYHLVGGGNKEHLLNEAKKANVEDQLIFKGELTLEEVYEELDKIDIYIQPSLQEGLPRAVIEAMSRACPCIGANTAGIPELLNKECITKCRSSHDIVIAIEEMLSNGLEKYAIENFENSKDYLEDRLNLKRNNYFETIKDKIND